MKRFYKSIDWSKVEKYLIDLPKPIKFFFSPPYAPHHAGLVEAMVKATKNSLYATLGRQRATLEEFRTILCNSEAIINSRPLTAVGQDARDPLPITPAHLLLGRSLQHLPDELTRDDTTSSVALQFRDRGRLSTEFWNRFRSSYLAELQKIQKWHTRSSAPRVGEFVMIHENIPNRMNWPIGVITEVFEGRDNLVRSVMLQSKGRPAKRAITQIFRLEEDAEHAFDAAAADLTELAALPPPEQPTVPAPAAAAADLAPPAYTRSRRSARPNQDARANMIRPAIPLYDAAAAAAAAAARLPSGRSRRGKKR
jgi:hypothetical protein